MLMMLTLLIFFYFQNIEYISAYVSHTTTDKTTLDASKLFESSICVWFQLMVWTTQRCKNLFLFTSDYT